ncbi:MAG TPA: Stk1 family PASTA domain-containing Ser/Thr kinase [Candidatus Ruminococcus gallistercoris]|nr:Stk1 family PASTA domain-containing Ser/Thr kinase [Candidatus Ruminococcus gallistercoris]
MDKYIGKRLDGRYEIHELIGQGGMAYVYRAYDRIENRWVAIKILREELSDNSDFLRRFRNESKAIAVLSHPNIVKVYDVSFGDRIQYIVMEYVDGITLKQYIEQQGEIKWREALYFTVQILQALQHAHERGIIHRDIKPQNIMLLEDGSIKVMDFGIARFTQAETQTMTDKAIGSVHYIAPEQARGGHINDKADIYSVGVMLYEMLTGQLPFVADNAVSVAIMQMQAEPTPPTRINPSIPKGLEEITMHAMEKNPAQRFPSAADMLEDVERFRRNPEMVFNYGDQVDHAYARGTSIYDTAGGRQQDYNDNYEYEEEYVRSKNGAKASMVVTGIVAAVVVVGLVVGGIFLWNYFRNNTDTSSDEVIVPTFTGMIYETEIKDNAEYADFEFEIVEGNQPSQPAGVVLNQNPQAGMTVKRGKTITLTVNGGTLEQVVVEDVTGDSQQDAYDTLEALGLSPRIQAVADDETAVGYVVRTDPAAGSTVASGSSITIFVSSGPAEEQVTVPNVVGSSLSTAESDLEANGLVRGSVSYDDESDQPEGTVLSSDPEGGTRVSEGSAVNLVVSSGRGAEKTVHYDIPLPSGVSEDLEMSIYVDGELFDSRVVNPSVSSYSGVDFTGTGRSSLTIRLNGQDYITAEINYETESIDVHSQIAFATPTPEPTAEPTPAPDAGTGTGDTPTGPVTTH